MKASVEGLEKERDFYFGKLRDIEVLCQEREGEEFTKGILNVLYATEVSSRFVFGVWKCRSEDWCKNRNIHWAPLTTSKETARYSRVLVVTKLFNMAVNDFDAKNSARYSQVLVVTELVLSGTQCR